jgi:hypothetical protein
MPLTLSVDRNRIEGVDSTDIAHAFESLDRRSGGAFTGPGLSMIILERDAAHLLMATGTYAAGFVLSHHDGDPEYEYNSDMNQPVTVEEVTKIFQAYARGEDWGQSKFKWEPFDSREGNTSKIIKRLLGIGFLGYLAYVVVKITTK